jgi:DNA-binding NtrC family response regulator
LLRVLQEKTVERVGSSQPIRVDVRVIAATHQNLEELIRSSRFREDLYYRLNVIELRLPPLRERREDIAELASTFLRHYAERCSKHVMQIDDDALTVLKMHRWPGNIRELENVIERAVVVSEGASISVSDLPPELVSSLEAETDSMAWLGEAILAPAAFGTVRAERELRTKRERDQLVRALAASNGNKAVAARALGMARSTLVSRLKKHGLS